MKSGIAIPLAKAAPHIAFSVSYVEDPNFVWDGDGPDPKEDGYAPYDVTVTVHTIINGVKFEGDNYLGGTYEKWGSQGPEDPEPDIGGYLPQMIEEALDDLKDRATRTLGKLPAWLTKEIRAAKKACALYADKLQKSYARAHVMSLNPGR
jgi:hypothetical protein